MFSAGAEGLARIVEKARCRVIGWEDAGNDGHRAVLVCLTREFDRSDAAVLCEPSLARKTTRPPDVVLIDAVAGVHVIEVKSTGLDQIEAIQAGGVLRIRYASGYQEKSPISQVRKAMFDIKNAAEQSHPGEFSLPLRYWVVFPSIERATWFGRWGEGAYAPPEFVFADELPSFAQRLHDLGRERLRSNGQSCWPTD